MEQYSYDRDAITSIEGRHHRQELSFQQVIHKQTANYCDLDTNMNFNIF